MHLTQTDSCLSQTDRSRTIVAVVLVVDMYTVSQKEMSPFLYLL